MYFELVKPKISAIFEATWRKSEWQLNSGSEDQIMFWIYLGQFITKKKIRLSRTYYSASREG